MQDTHGDSGCTITHRECSGEQFLDGVYPVIKPLHGDLPFHFAGSLVCRNMSFKQVLSWTRILGIRAQSSCTSLSMHSHYQTGLMPSLNGIVGALRTYPTIDNSGMSISVSCTASIGVFQGTFSTGLGVVGSHCTHILHLPRRLGDLAGSGRKEKGKEGKGHVCN